jgi:hypothetical protein
MRNYIYTLVAATLLIGSCKSDHSGTCTFPVEPDMRQIHLSVIDYTNYKDLLVDGKFEPDSIVVIQPCSPSTPVRINVGSATRTDSDIVVRSISFDGLSSFSDWKDCQKFAIWWRNNDVDTVQFVLEKQRCPGNCCMTYYPRVLIEGQIFEPGSGIKGDDGLYFLVMKSGPQ